MASIDSNTAVVTTPDDLQESPSPPPTDEKKILENVTQLLTDKENVSQLIEGEEDDAGGNSIVDNKKLPQDVPGNVSKRWLLLTKQVSQKGPRKVDFMGTQKLLDVTYEDASKLQPADINEMWAIVKKTSDKEVVDVEPTKNRKGWRTIRIFVSSTFKDFHSEREVLVKEVFPDLRLWCEQRKLRLVECDLRWGVPKNSTTEETIKICLSEIDRCFEDNVAPFFLNLAGERAGWIPSFGGIAENLAAQYGWVYGLSVTEMEIVHGAFRKLNPNALFLLRQPDALDGIPADMKKAFCDCSETCVEKLKFLKQIIADTFPEDNIYKYQAKGSVQRGKVEFSGLSGDSKFSEKVYKFFKGRIEEQYPLDPSPEDPLQVQREAHETFLDSRSECVLGRDKLIHQIEDYYMHDDSRSPLLVIGTAGAGKSALMAKCASDAFYRAQNGELNLPNGHKEWQIFYHFVGATPGSTDLAFFLQRLTKEVKPDLKDIVSDLESLLQLTNSLLSNPNTVPTILFIDAVNQLDEDKQQFLTRWLPEILSPNVRVVVSMIEGTPTHQMLREYKPSPKEVMCGPLDLESRKEIVCNILKMYNKRLDPKQMETIVTKEGSSNPLWLTLACEELRVHGDFKDIIQKIESFPDDLISLEIDVFTRFEKETGGPLMKATLCMLEVSRHGLLETELLALLGDSNNVECPEYKEGEIEELLQKTEQINESAAPNDIDKDVEQLTDKFSKMTNEAYVIKDKDEEKKTEKRANRKQIVFLPARQWAIIYRNLKPLLRPCGDLGEGRLDFYHRSLSKAVRKKYFVGSDNCKKHMYNYWHGVLAGYFENVNDMDRKAEELPYHLELLLDNSRLIRCLLEWPIFDRLYSEDFSIDLLRSWQKAGGYAVASAMYKEALVVLKESGISLVEFAVQMEKVAMFLIQAGQYTEVYTILEERIAYELDNLGSRADKLADVYGLMAKCKSEVEINNNMLTMKLLESNKEVVEWCKKTKEYRKQLTGEENDFKMALNDMLLCLHLSRHAGLLNDDSTREDATAVINESIAVFEKMGDIGHLSEAIMTKSFIHRRGRAHFQATEDALMKSRELCLKAYGENHLLYTRLCANIGILYEDNRQFQSAYDYFVQWNNACTKVFGPNHPKSLVSKETLEEPRYAEIKAQRDRLAAGTA